MTFALGMIEVYGVPTAVEVADAMCKAARITFVGYENTDLGRITVLIRGAIGEVNVAVSLGLNAISRRLNASRIARVDGGELLSYHIIARPHENLEYALPIYHSVNVDNFSADIRFPPPLSA